jgi:ketosteroid isomerase-like protein
MSEKNVEIVMQAIQAFNRRGADTEVLSRFYDPEIEFHEDPKLPEPGVYRGSEAVAGYLAQYLEAFDEYKFEIEEILDAGDKVLVFNRQQGRGRGSGATVEMRNAWLFSLRGGRIVRVRPYWNRAEALAAAGLPAGVSEGD